MRAVLFACLVVVLVMADVAIQSMKDPSQVALSQPQAGRPVASIGDVFRHF
jgi:hypothetical protein